MVTVADSRAPGHPLWVWASEVFYVAAWERAPHVDDRRDLVGGQRAIATPLGHVDVGTIQRYTHVDAVSVTQPLVEERWRRLRGE